MNGFDDVFADVCMICDGKGCPCCIDGIVMRIMPLNESYEEIMDQINESVSIFLD